MCLLELPLICVNRYLITFFIYIYFRHKCRPFTQPHVTDFRGQRKVCFEKMNFCPNNVSQWGPVLFWTPLTFTFTCNWGNMLYLEQHFCYSLPVIFSHPTVHVCHTKTCCVWPGHLFSLFLLRHVSSKQSISTKCLQATHGSDFSLLRMNLCVWMNHLSAWFNDSQINKTPDLTLNKPVFLNKSV